jgi:phosphopantothenoylcysteine decarboxylase/phosphopantothenate--cysteine ligase
MSKGKIVLQVTGSIAAYKACFLASSLIKEDYEVQVIMTGAALQFVGKASFEGLTGMSVKTDVFEEGSMMEHIKLVKWADLFLLYPATANTINKLNSGIADELIGATFLANNFHKPYWIAPAMNSNMFEHPTVQKSLKNLKKAGAYIFDTEEGYLACGDTGRGRLINPEIVLKKIQEMF